MTEFKIRYSHIKLDLMKYLLMKIESGRRSKTNLETHESRIYYEDFYIEKYASIQIYFESIIFNNVIRFTK